MLAGVGWTTQEYLKHGENDYYQPLPNGHRLFLHDIRWVAVRAAFAMGEEGDMVVFTCPEGVCFYQRKILKPIFINQSRSSQRCGITSNLGFYTCCLQQEFYVL